MKRQPFLLSIFLAFAFCTTPHAVFAKDKGKADGDKSDAKPAKAQKKPEPKPDKAMRFRGLDRNNDSVISRHEWHDDNPTFDRLDSSRDGVLTRDEFSARDNDQQVGFSDLDHNRDGMIALSEWRGDAQLFERRDTDRDGLLSRAEFFHRP